MKRLQIASLIALSMAVGAGAAFAQDKKEEMPSPAVEAYAKEFLAKWGNDPKLIEAIKASTAKHSRLSFDESTILDQQWRLARTKGKDDEVNKAAAEKVKATLGELAPGKKVEDHMAEGEALIKGARENETSAWLAKQQDGEGGKITEIFVMDGMGWNVGQTGGTSDYYQGDEGKWQLTYASDGVEILPIVEEDGIRYSQVSLPIKEGDKNIGAVTIGVDVDKVK